MNCQICLKPAAAATTTTASGFPACDDCHGLDWWHDCGNIAALYRWLAERGELDTDDVSAVSEVIATPWSWTDEYRQALAANALEQADELRTRRICGAPPHETRS